MQVWVNWRLMSVCVCVKIFLSGYLSALHLFLREEKNVPTGFYPVNERVSSEGFSYSISSNNVDSHRNERSPSPS